MTDATEKPQRDGSARSDRLPRWLVAAAIPLVLVLFAAHAWLFRAYVNDDAYITFRYSRNLATGLGPYFNAGEHVEGYTNFLLMLLLAPVHALGGETAVPAMAKGIGVVAAAGALLVTLSLAWRLRPRTEASDEAFALSWGVTAAGLTAAAPGFAVNSLSGLETTLFSFLVLGGVSSAIKNLAGGRWSAPAIWFGLAVLTRPEGIAVFAVAWVGLAIGSHGWRRPCDTANHGLAPRDAPRGRRSLVALAFAVLAFFGAHLAFRWLAYDGELLPNTYWAKEGGFWGRTPWEYVRAGVITPLAGFAGAALALLGWAVPGAPRRPAAAIAAVALFGACLPLLIGTDWMIGWRFTAPYLPFLALIAAFGWLRLASFALQKPWWLAPSLVVAVVPAAWLLQSEERASLREYVEVKARGYRNGHGALADWLRHDAARPGDTIALMDIGIVSYRCIEQRILDITGLTDRHIAKSPGKFLLKRYDPQYVLGQEPEFLVLAYTGPPSLFAANPADVPLRPWSPLESRLSEQPEFARWYRDEHEGRDTSPDWMTQIAARLGAERIFVHDDPVALYVLAVHRRRAEAEPLRPGWGAREWFAEGLQQMRGQAFADALFAFRAALELDPGNAVLRTNAAYCLLDLGRAEEAEDDFRAILADAPDAHDARFGLAQAVERSGRPDLALPLWREYVRLAPESQWKDKARAHIDRLTAR